MFISRNTHTAEERALLAGGDPEAIFTHIHRHRLWHGKESASGPASDPEATAELSACFPGLCHALGITRILDLPCGDFLWMSRALPKQVRYIGGDIVGEVIAGNLRGFANDRVDFRILDLLAGPWPEADLMVCRDALVHLSFHHLGKFLRVLAEARIDWLLATHFPAEGPNIDIATGQWRPLDLTKAPFHFPPPVMMLPDTGGPAAGTTKCLGLWPWQSLPRPE